MPALGERLERRGEPLVDEHRGKDAASELAQLGQRAVQLRLRGVDEPGGVSADLRAQEPQREREHHEPLLRPVVQVALEPTALGIAGLDAACP